MCGRVWPVSAAPCCSRETAAVCPSYAPLVLSFPSLSPSLPLSLFSTPRGIPPKGQRSLSAAIAGDVASTHIHSHTRGTRGRRKLSASTPGVRRVTRIKYISSNCTISPQVGGAGLGVPRPAHTTTTPTTTTPSGYSSVRTSRAETLLCKDFLAWHSLATSFASFAPDAFVVTL